MMKKRLLSVAMAFCMLLAAVPYIGGQANAATYYSATIQQASDSRIPAMLNAVSNQAFPSAVAVSDVKSKLSYFILEGPWAAIDGSKFPYPNNAPEYFVTITDGTYTKTVRGKGCFAYASFVSQVIYGTTGDRLNLSEAAGKMTENGLKSFLKEYAQAGEHIRVDGSHSLAFISSTEDGFYYLDYRTDSNPYITLTYTTYSNFVKKCNEVGKQLWIYNANPQKNSQASAGNEPVLKNSQASTDGTSMYSLYEGTLSYQDAGKFCKEHGGTLACITSAAEQSVVEAMVKQFGSACWLGATDESGAWLWVSGESFSYANWAPYEPSGTIANGQKEAYLGMHGSGASAGKWNDFQKNSTSVKGFVLEAPLGKIALTSAPKTTIYDLGQTLSTEGMTVLATYKDGSSRIVTASCAVSGFDSQKEGTQTITVSYAGKTTQFQVTVGEILSELFTIHFDANGGTVSPAAQTVEYGKAVGTLPVPTREGYDFYCWYFEQNGTRYMVEETTKYNVKRDSTFYAYWVKKPDTQDGPSDWAKTEVETADSLGLIPSDLKSKYQTEITRAEFCRLIVNMLEKVCEQDIADILKDAELVVDPNAFTDTNDPDILAAYTLGIIKGIGNQKFSPNGNITREDAATMLMRTYYGADMEDEAAVQPVNYADRSQIGSWARTGVDLASTMKDPVSGVAVMQGIGGNKFGPKGTYTREQAYLTILRLYRCLNE